MQDARTDGPSHAATAHAHTRGHTRAHLQARCCALGSCWPVRKLPLTSSERVVAVIPQRGPRGGRKLRSGVDRRTVKAPETARGDHASRDRIALWGGGAPRPAHCRFRLETKARGLSQMLAKDLGEGEESIWTWADSSRAMSV